MEEEMGEIRKIGSQVFTKEVRNSEFEKKLNKFAVKMLDSKKVSNEEKEFLKGMNELYCAVHTIYKSPGASYPYLTLSASALLASSKEISAKVNPQILKKVVVKYKDKPPLSAFFEKLTDSYLAISKQDFTIPAAKDDFKRLASVSSACLIEIAEIEKYKIEAKKLENYKSLAKAAVSQIKEVSDKSREI